MKPQRKRLVPGRPHKPTGLRWSPYLGWHRISRYCADHSVARCDVRRHTGSRGRRIPTVIPF